LKGGGFAVKKMLRNFNNSKGGESRSQVKSRGKRVISNVIDSWVPVKFKVLSCGSLVPEVRG